MSERRAHLTDHQIEELLRTRSVEADRVLFDRILLATDHLPQRGAGWLRLPPDRRVLTLIVTALLLAALTGAIALAGRLIPEPDPAPLGPEGGWVLYADGYGWHLSDPAGNQTLVVRNGAKTLRECPAFSPDGHLIAYRESETGAVVVVAALEGDGTLVPSLRIESAPWACPGWSPDGRFLAFMGYEGEAWIASLDGMVRKVAHCQRGLECISAMGLAWTHDGSSLVVLSGQGAAAEVVAIPLDRGSAQAVHDATVWERFSAIVPSPTGPYIAVVGSRHRRPADGPLALEYGFVRVIDLDGQVVFEETTDSYLESGVAWSPDGTRLAWGDRNRLGIRGVESDSETVRLQLPPMPRAGTDTHLYGNSLAWSPDGERFLLHVSTNAEGHAHAIVSIAADGSGNVVVHSPWTASLETSFHGFAWQPR